MRMTCGFAANMGFFRNRRCLRRRGVTAWLLAGLATLLPAQAPGATKPQPAASSPILVPIKRAHCHRMYDVVAKRLQPGKETVSPATRNGLKDFFVVRPGIIDCKGERQIPWRASADRDFIVSVIEATNVAFKSKVNMTNAYGIGPASASVSTPSR